MPYNSLGGRVVGLNIFTAVCAALTLGILARSVRLLAHDRTKEQRMRAVQLLMARMPGRTLPEDGPELSLTEGEEFALLPVRAAFIPAAFAVLLLAAQLTFWENAVSGSGEMIDLLVFSFLILCLLEFRISRNDRRLSLFTFIYGLGVANNWALIGFFPCFLLAVLWLKGREFFNWRFVLRMAGWGVLGLMLYGLIPLLGALKHDGSFWELLHQKLAEQHIYLFRTPRYFAFIAGTSTLVPLLFAAIKWPSFEGEVSSGAHNIVNVSFRLLHIVLLAVGVLMFFDVKLSPSPRNLGMGIILGAPDFLTFYYVAALNVGYFTGYLLLVFGDDGSDPWRKAPGIVRVINRAMTGLVWLAAVALPAILFGENFPHIRDFKCLAVTQFANEMAKGLPAGRAVVLADDPSLLYLTMGASQRMGLPDQYAFIETRWLDHREYLRYLADRYPTFGKELINPDRFPAEITDQQIGLLLARMSKRQPVYYLHPSFGNYFELVCMTPRRLGEDLHASPTNVLATLMLPPAQIAANQAYWRALEKESLASLPELAKRIPDARRVANYYSLMLDNWGAELQKASTTYKLPLLLNDARDEYAEAIRLNPNNIMARVNQQYNAHLRGVPATDATISPSNVAALFYGHWDAALIPYGPADVPDLDIQIGRYFAERGAYLQAAHLFQRCLELAPNDAAAQVDLAKTYIDLGLVDAALDLVGKAKGTFSGNPLELVRVEALAYATKGDFAQADKLLTEEHKKNPKDNKFTAVMAEFYRLMGYNALRKGKYGRTDEKTAENDAAIWFGKALAALAEELRFIDAPAANGREISNINLRRAEIQMTSKDYAAAINTFTEMLRQDPKNPIPLLNRAISELQINRLDAAKSDYLELEKTQPSQMVYYGLAQVAEKQQDAPAEVRYSKLFLESASPSTPGFTNVTGRLRKLEGR